MTAQMPGLLQALNAKMNYLNQRQQVISQNIANANTPGYRPKDLEKVDFGSMMEGLVGNDQATLQPVETNPMHMSATPSPEEARAKAAKHTYDVSPTGNAVVMEEQMVKSAETMTDYNLMTAIYEKNISMTRVALGEGR